jgi:hypothetical protein
MKNYLKQDEIGIIEGVKVQCLPINESEAEEWQKTDGGVCKYYNCTFYGKFLDCKIPCCNYERPDKTSVYFFKVE